MQFDEQSLQQITIDVCQSMLGLELQPLEPDVEKARQLLAAVEIRGDRNSVVEVFADDNLMAKIAEVMFNSDRGNLSEGDVKDAFCEIANMIGGNVKGVFGGEADLSLPVLRQAGDLLDQLPIGSIRASFECCGHPLTIVLRELLPIEQTSEVATCIS